MRIRGLLNVAGTLAGLTALCLAGCQSSQQQATAVDENFDAASEERGIAEASLGKQSEILAQGDLALTGREQLLVVNRFRQQGAAGKDGASAGPVFITRAAVLEKADGKWTEILRCDEHLKNPDGYLGGVPKARMSGWRLEFSQDAKAGLDMKFSPVENLVEANGKTAETTAQPVAIFDVRWNKNTKRYMSFDQSHERYLTELPSLETPESSLR